MPPPWAYVLIGGVAALCTYVAVFPIRRLAARVGFVAEPDQRRIHARITPYGGGLGMFAAFVVAVIVASRLAWFRELFSGSSEPLGVVLAALVIFAVGMIDDVRDVSAPAKMAGQVLAAMVLVFTGVTMFWFKIPFAGFWVLSPAFLPLLTALWVIVITNAVNLIDGLDGLAAGIVAIASGTLAVYGVHQMNSGYLPADNLGPLIASITCGVCIGFLPHNFNPARVFMGDAGALFLGLLMAVSTMVIGGRTTEVSGQTYFFFAPLFIPLFILGVPIADMAFAFIRRTAKRQGFHTPDKDHIHHRLLRLGHGQRRTVVILWAWTAVLSGFVLYPLYRPSGNAIIPFGIVVLGLLLYTLFHPGLRKEQEGVEEEREESQGHDLAQVSGFEANLTSPSVSGPSLSGPSLSSSPSLNHVPELHDVPSTLGLAGLPGLIAPHDPPGLADPSDVSAVEATEPVDQGLPGLLRGNGRAGATVGNPVNERRDGG
ncbi:MAG TPA: MraY family glycosyltransferase [Acidimicrobiales bacterium]|nr:MraY family glycosyltransferase [Acidimicrobiales bacterium]